MTANASLNVKKRKNLTSAGESANRGSHIETNVAFPQKNLEIVLPNEPAHCHIPGGSHVKLQKCLAYPCSQ